LNGTVENDSLLGPRFEDALVYALHAHDGHLRKGSRVPYVSHLLGVCALVLEDGGGEDEAIAALLHDAVEDQGGLERLDDIRSRFGERVAQIVAECSDSFETPKRPWRERKDGYLAHLEEASPEALRVSLADKVYNARTILGDYRQLGDALWERFTASREETLWYYRSLTDEYARLRPGPLVDELEGVVAELERAVAGTTS
jgi:(p)ppGpp synthase/HD superfamily hydrolase